MVKNTMKANDRTEEADGTYHNKEVLKMVRGKLQCEVVAATSSDTGIQCPVSRAKNNICRGRVCLTSRRSDAKLEGKTRCGGKKRFGKERG